MEEMNKLRAVQGVVSGEDATREKAVLKELCCHLRFSGI